MPQVVLLTGSNMGDRAFLLKEACRRIDKRVGSVVRTSRVYESDPWGFEAQEAFLNQVLVSETELEPTAVLDEIQAIEKELGRVRAENQARDSSGERVYESRAIDIDILFYDNLVMESERLIIPHALIAEREFVLVPLCELMGDYLHPVLETTLSELLKRV